MKAVILAAGRGSRLGELTKERPKGLVKLLGLTLLERAILSAKEGGVEDFVIVIGYKGEKIREEIGDGKRYSARIRYCLLYTSPSPRDLSTSRMPSSA